MSESGYNNGRRRSGDAKTSTNADGTPRKPATLRKPGSGTIHGRSVFDKTEWRADFVIELRGKHPQASYAEILKMLRERYPMGITAAQQAYARAMERLRTIRESKDGEAQAMLQAFFGQLMVEAKARGDFAEARKAADSYAKYTCDLEPVDVAIVRPIDDDAFDDCTDEELELMARVHAKQIAKAH